MNIHPLFVHFPIALLTVYALAELVRVKRLTGEMWWWNVKALLLGVGLIGGFAALQTGEMAEHLRERSGLIEIHSTYATATVWIFAAIALMYIVAGIRMFASKYVQEGVVRKVFSVFLKLEQIIRYVLPALVLVGLITLVITGSLGGAIVYGPDVDPVVNFIYSVVVGN